MNVRYCGVYWIARKDELPEDGVMCVFHVKWRKPDNICFGYYAFDCFHEAPNTLYKKNQIDYWMPIPVFPEEEK